MEIAIVVAAAAMGLLGVLWAAARNFPDPRKGYQPLDIARRIAEEERVFEAAIDTRAAWAREFYETVTRSCVSAPVRLDVDAAHRMMREHRECSSVWCATRAAALEVLRLNGHYVPAERAEERRSRLAE
jgi:hypothetical protein